VSRLSKCCVVLMLAAVSGCQSEDSQLAVRTNWYIVDVPVPKGFDRNNRESTYSSSPSGRRILDVYEGGAEPIKVRNFYLSNMPASQWKFENESLAGGVYTLTFTKANETCAITIGKKADKGLFAPTEARVLVEGASAGSKKQAS